MVLLGGWLLAGLVVSVALGRAARGDRPPPPPLASTEAPASTALWAAEAAASFADTTVVALHGLRASGAVVAGGAAHLAAGWAQLEPDQRTQLLATLAEHAALIESQVDDLLRDVPATLRQALDDLTELRPVEQLAAAEAVLVGATVGRGRSAGGAGRPPSDPVARQGDPAGEQAPDATVLRLRRPAGVARRLASAAAAAALVVGAATASRGALPPVAQDPIAHVADRLGIELPSRPAQDAPRAEPAGIPALGAEPAAARTVEAPPAPAATPATATPPKHESTERDPRPHRPEGPPTEAPRPSGAEPRADARRDARPGHVDGSPVKGRPDQPRRAGR